LVRTRNFLSSTAWFGRMSLMGRG